MSTLPPDDADSRSISRRRAIGGTLGLIGGAAIGGLMPALALASLDCVVTPAEEEGPYFVDERLNRADIRRDPTTGAVSDGLPLLLRVSVARVDGASCAPLAGAMVDVWHCDALGVYSDVKDTDGHFDTRGRKFLRGHQVTGRDGVAQFTTVYPGWYPGRTPHIHFKVRTSGAGKPYAFTSQWYFDEAVTDAVHARPPYARKGRRDTRNTADEIFRDQHGSRLMLNLAKSGAGYLASYAVGLRVA